MKGKILFPSLYIPLDEVAVPGVHPNHGVAVAVDMLPDTPNATSVRIAVAESVWDRIKASYFNGDTVELDTSEYAVIPTALTVPPKDE